MSKPKIGFIGLGIMGLPMAANLIKADYPLIAYDLNEKPLEEITQAGAQKANSNSDVASKSDIIITMLPNSPDVQKAVFSEGGITEGLSSGQILIDMSSIAPLVSQEIARKLKEKGVDMLDAPVSGGQEKAQSGTLAIMVGGEEDTFNTCKPILDILGNPVLVGDIGAGGTTKLVNQAIVAVNIAVVAEALLLGKKAGVDPKRIFDAIKGGLAGSQCLTDKAPRMFKANYDPGFRMKLHVKDLTNVLSTSQALHNAMPLTVQVMEMMQTLIAEGYTEIDHGGLALFYEKINGISLKED
ncbi:MAG: 2-hydroxy-3-oxopropionate reductase [Atribacterota bacterium]|jgi:2-hydroxy-3-oxopropionate reductase|nr:2-hydroxy-3-oxopropionate reductase [Atribacterota bacterium]